MMKKFTVLFVVFSGLFLSISCEKTTDEENTIEDPLLHVEFQNSSESEFTITNIQMVSHGNAGETDEGPIGEWSDNILPNSQNLAPGEVVEMDLAIPNLYKYMYRIQVLDESNNLVWLHEQEGFEGDGGGSITHWGSHNREVYCTVMRNTSTGLIYIQGWGDNAY